MSAANQTSSLWDLVEPYLAAERVELDDVDVRGAGRNHVVKIVVDAEGGVDVDRIAEISRGISRLLDDQPPFDGSYTLEVSSPGLERVLRRPRHYEKSVGREIKLHTAEAVDGDTSHRGVLAHADDSGIRLEAQGSQRHIAYDQIVSAETIFRWGPKAGSR